MQSFITVSRFLLSRARYTKKVKKTNDELLCMFLVNKFQINGIYTVSYCTGCTPQKTDNASESQNFPF